MKKLFCLATLLALTASSLNAQNFEVSVSGIKEGDSIRLIVQQEKKYLFQQWVSYSSEGSSLAIFDNLTAGQWALSIDATGYTFPTASVFNFPEITEASVELTPLLNDNFTYSWRDDDSAAGHSTQSYVSEPTEIIVLNDTVSVPSSFSAISLRNEFGILLSDDVEVWSKEDAYRLYNAFTRLPEDILVGNREVDFENNINVAGIFFITSDEIAEDISIEFKDDVKHITISRSAFTYAEPQIVKLDGIRGQFFSKRLYHAAVNFYTDFGNDSDRIDRIANENFGFRFMSGNDETQELMGEDKSNFQEFTKWEKLEILTMFEELPEGFHSQEGLKYLVRRVNGQSHPIYTDASALAHTSRNTIEFMESSFVYYDLATGDIRSQSLSFIRNLILHEKAHFLWAYTFDDNLKDDWIDIGGWFLDPTSAGGWSTYNTTESVSAYAHSQNPNEDMAESISRYLTNPDNLMNVSMRKYEFIRDRVMHGTRYVAQIREDLTFTVYNLYPDYTFPGKVIGVDITVEGEAEEDKRMFMKVTLESENPEIDGASGGYMRFYSSIGTMKDFYLSPQNGTLDSILIGETEFSKFAKSGYWTPSTLSISDELGNTRYENTSTLGVKLYLENPLEDIIPPQFNDDFTMDSVFGKFSRTSGTYRWNMTPDDSDGEETNTIHFEFSWDDVNNLQRSDIRLLLPSKESYSVDFLSDYTSVDGDRKYFDNYMQIQEFFPTGYYKVVFNSTSDIAGNGASVYHVDDPDNFYINPARQPPNQFKTLRDSIYIETPFADALPPQIDVNRIDISAVPTNPNAPNGETRVDVQFIARDFSSYEGKESGIRYINLGLRDPKGKEFYFQTGNGTMNHTPLYENKEWEDPDYGDDWRVFNFNFLLPAGSAAGVWGLSEISINDMVGNINRYSFIEYIRFDVIESDVVLEEPLEIEIIDKVINAGNVDAVKVRISCIPCQGLGYVATIYSRFGGGAVVRNEGTLDANEVIIENLGTYGIVDGEVNLTVQLIDSESNLIATKTTAYTKDVVYPSAYYTRSNLQDEGHSNLDDLVVDVEYSSEDEGGTYTYETGQATTSGIRNTRQSGRGYPSVNYSISPSAALQTYTGELVGDVSIDDIDLSAADLGLLYGKLSVTDPNGNKGQDDVTDYFVVTLSGARIKRIKKYRDNDIDFDDDGAVNEQDAFPYDASETLDTDSDGVGNNADTDDDGDDWSDEVETAEGTDPLDAQSVPIDTDGDGIGNVTDTDDDGDEVPDTEDAFPLDATESIDTDSDGIGNNADTDDDGDDWSDADETAEGTDPLDAQSVPIDTDGDGIGNVTDTDDDGDEVPDTEDAFPLDATESIDTDNDGIGNNADTDDDGDSWTDEDETAEGTDPLDAQSVPVDSDGDGIGNVTDTDDDGDEVPDVEDAFPLDATESIDTDSDGVGNNADTDDDGDEVPDTEDAFPLDATEAYDADGDGVGDNADDDDDNDQIKDVNDECPNSALGVTVDAKGCEVFALPSNTFTVSVTSATCPDSSNGQIIINSNNTDYSYRYSINEQAPVAITSNSQSINNLSAGIYTVCVTVDGVSDYQRCYTIEITEPAPLVASSRIDMSARNMELDLSGSKEYQVTINGKTFLTTEDRLSLNLEPGMNRVEVATALDCQGVYFEEIFVSEEVKVYPNPTPGPLQLFVAGSDTEVELNITTLSGNVIRRETLAVPANRIIETSLGSLPEGLYLITLNGTTVKTTHKVIKE